MASEQRTEPRDGAGRNVVNAREKDFTIVRAKVVRLRQVPPVTADRVSDPRRSACASRR